MTDYISGRDAHCASASTECFEKARELGHLVLQSEFADRVRIAHDVGTDEIALADARDKFDQFFAQIVDVLTATVSGKMPAEEPKSGCGGCGGGCSGKH